MPSINLLDPQRKLAVAERLRTRRVVLFFIHVIVVVLIQIATLLAWQVVLAQKQTALLDQFASTRIVAGGKTLPVAQTVKQLNAQLHQLKPALVNAPTEVLLTEMANRIPTGITLATLSLSWKTKQLTVTGVARSRNDTPPYQQALESIPRLAQIRTESNLNERTNISFTTTATVDLAPLP